MVVRAGAGRTSPSIETLGSIGRMLAAPMPRREQMAVEPAETKMVQEVRDLLNEVLYRPVRWRSAFEETVDRLAQAIKLGAVQPGSPLPPERDLVNKFQISRTTLREALRALQQHGYLETRRGRSGGTFVAKSVASLHTPAEARRLAREMGDSLFEAMDLRAAVEPKAAEFAASRASPDSIARLQLILECYESARPMESRRWDSTLHIAIAEAADSTLLLDSVLRVQVQLHELLDFISMPYMETVARRSSSLHSRVVEAIARRKDHEARDAMEEHISLTTQVLREIVSPSSRSARKARGISR